MEHNVRLREIDICRRFEALQFVHKGAVALEVGLLLIVSGENGVRPWVHKTEKGGAVGNISEGFDAAQGGVWEIIT